MEVKIGIGYDSHRFAEGRRFVLGGVLIPFEKGLIGHSDADALAHSVIDALLGAVHLGDIGKLFPDSDPRFKNANSIELLRAAYQKVKNEGYIVNNIDSVVILERPKILAYTELMEENIAKVVETSVQNVSVKVKTNERMGFVGREEGIVTISTVLVRRV